MAVTAKHCAWEKQSARHLAPHSLHAGEHASLQSQILCKATMQDLCANLHCHWMVRTQGNERSEDGLETRLSRITFVACRNLWQILAPPLAEELAGDDVIRSRRECIDAVDARLTLVLLAQVIIPNTQRQPNDAGDPESGQAAG